MFNRQGEDRMNWIWSLIGMFIVGILLLCVIPEVANRCEGEKEWSHYTGVFEWIDVETDQCCHFRTWIKLENHSKIWTVDGNKDLETMFIPGEIYTFYLEPFPEPAAATVGCFWDQVIDYVEDDKGNVVYGWK